MGKHIQMAHEKASAEARVASSPGLVLRPGLNPLWAVHMSWPITQQTEGPDRGHPPDWLTTLLATAPLSSIVI